MTQTAQTGRTRPPSGRISLLVSDVDGTLVTDDKVLTDPNIAAVRRLRDAGIAFAIVSSRPPRGMRHLVEPLGLDVIAGFNGGAIVRADLRVLEEHLVPAAAARRAAAMLATRGADLWCFSDDQWYLTNPDGAYVGKERHTVQFEPTLVASFGDRLDRAGKLVASSADFGLLERAETDLQALLGDTAAAHRSQLYYLDVTHPMANKGYAAKAFAGHFGVPLEEVAVIGDMANDLAMFDVAGLAIAMGNAPPPVQARADFVTTSNADNGVAHAIERWVLPRGGK
jgi:Cof subfamily protein (haloacid dehalogenase superfamily)